MMLDTTNTRRATDHFLAVAHETDHKEGGLVVNGVRAPTKNDANFEVWAALNNLRAEWGSMSTVVTAIRLAKELSRDENSTVMTFLQWEKFHAE
jgi:hypothetical protein